MEMLILIAASVLYFAVPQKLQKYLNLILTAAFIYVTTSKASSVLINDAIFSYSFRLWENNIILSLDKLSSFFVLIINFTILTSSLFSFRYMDMYNKKSQAETALHYFCFYTLYWSMILVTMLQNTICFLVAWEIMSLSSFMLVMFEAEKATVRKAGLNYLIQMHVGAVLLLTGILVLHRETGSWEWNALGTYFSGFSNPGLFFVFFAGFGLKAGFIPMHTWLPHAHPAAPTHVSAIMSGVMIKLGIFGILRMAFFLQEDLLLIGIIVLAISVLSGISGVGVAIIQHNLKKLLAYSSIENIGIIGIGLGIGIIGMDMQNAALTWMGFAGCFLHVLNHSLFKSLLFYGAGSVYSATHSVNIDSMGGLIRKMPFTALFFLIASMAICGLPPFNGFVSEFLIYNGFIEALQSGNVFIKVLMIFSILGLTTIGGLAIYCFTRAFGIIFLGNPRSQAAEHVVEMNWQVIVPQILVIIMIVAIGIFPEIFIVPVNSIIRSHVPITQAVEYDTTFLRNAGMAGAGFIALVALLWLIRMMSFRKKKVEETVTWNCGFAAEAPKTQYTASSYAENFSHAMDKSLNITTHYHPIDDTEVFPAKRHYKTHSESLIEQKLLLKPLRVLYAILKRLAFVQTGQTQHYILYAFVLLIALLLLTIFKVI